MRINESPDSFYIDGKRIGYTREDAISFIIFREGFIVYSTAGVEGVRAPNEFASGHVALAKAWILKLKKERGISLSEKDEEDWNFYKGHLKTYGEMGPEAELLAQDFLSGDKNKRRPTLYEASSSMLKGRMWKGMGVKRQYDHNEEYPETDKVISFWNRANQVESMSQLVTKVIELVGENPKEYIYELDYSFKSYYEFLNIKEDKIDYSKDYVIKGKVYKWADFEKLRLDMHLGAGGQNKIAIAKLCGLLTPEVVEKYPELKGIRSTVNCDSLPKDDLETAYKKAKNSGWGAAKTEIERGLEPSRVGLRRRFGGAAAKRITKNFFQGKGPDPEGLNVSLNPGDTAGIKGRTLGGFRARTQREIDAAWDDFMRTREHSSPEKISFKEWFSFLEQYFQDEVILKEDPNEVSRNPTTGRPKLKFDSPSAVTFILFKDYFVYAPSAKGAMHDGLAQWLVFKNFYKDYLESFEKMNPWCGSIKELGKPSKGALKTLEHVSDQLNSGTDGRNAFLRTNPEVILGRLWVSKNVVSFWNYWPYVTKGSERILRFVSMFGDPSKFEYDVRNMEASYEDLLHKKPVPSSREVPSVDETI